MTFNSLEYFLFLPVVYLAHHFAPERVRWMILLAASLLFYAALEVPYLMAVLLLVASVTYAFGIRLAGAATPQARHRLLWAGIAANVLVLGVMKYMPHRAFLAVGVSFYVFQAISYLVDTYLDIGKPERHFGYFLLYLSFFPKLLQGPIERAGDLLPQLKRPYVFDYDNVRGGMIVFAWGLFKKVVVADRMAFFVNAVYDDVHAYTGLTMILATYLYAFQIYFDFSAYTDMALGTARVFNIRLTQNFNSPYLAVSIADFWRRWHISFSRWILDYIFRPLQMRWRDWGTHGTGLALVVTFLVSGVWHGAARGFVIWGLLHGCYLAASVYYRPLQGRIHAWLAPGNPPWLRAWRVAVTFNLACFAWIFFRARSTRDALHVVTRIFADLRSIPAGLHGLDHAAGGFLARAVAVHTAWCVEALFLLAGLAVVAAASLALAAGNWDGIDGYLMGKPGAVRWLLYSVLAVSIAVLGVSARTDFIYGRF